MIVRRRKVEDERTKERPMMCADEGHAGIEGREERKEQAANSLGVTKVKRGKSFSRIKPTSI